LVGLREMRRRHLTFFLCFSLVLTPFRAFGDWISESDQVAARAIDALSKKDISKLAGLIHYPVDFTPEEVREDSEGISAGLAFLFERFGNPKDIRPHTGPSRFFEIGMFGGTTEYWESLSPFESRDYLFTATFDFGTGFIKIRTFRHAQRNEPQIQAVAMGIPTHIPNSKTLAADAMVGMMKAMEIPIPDGYREFLDEHFLPIFLEPTDSI